MLNHEYIFFKFRALTLKIPAKIDRRTQVIKGRWTSELNSKKYGLNGSLVFLGKHRGNVLVSKAVFGPKKSRIPEI